MDNDMSAYKSDFLQEVYECLDVFNQAFVNLENGDEDAINEIFRIAHTIKGMAGFLNYKSLEKLCHNMEGVLSGIKDGEIEVDSDLIDTMLLAVDRITEMVKQIESQDSDNIEITDLLKVFENYKEISECRHESNAKEPEISEEIKKEDVKQEEIKKEDVKQEEVKQEEVKKEDVRQKKIKPEESNISSEKNLPINIEDQNENKANELRNAEEDYNLVLDVTLSEDCMMKDLRASLIIESLKDICKVFKISPSEDEMENDFDGNFTVFLSGSEKQVESLMDRISEIEYFNIKSTSKSSENSPEMMDSPANASGKGAETSETTETIETNEIIETSEASKEVIETTETSEISDIEEVIEATETSEVSEETTETSKVTEAAKTSEVSEETTETSKATKNSGIINATEVNKAIEATEISLEKGNSAEHVSNNINILLLTLLNLITKIQIILNKLNKKAFGSEESTGTGYELPKNTLSENLRESVEIEASQLIPEPSGNAIQEENTVENRFSEEFLEKSAADSLQSENLGIEKQNSEEPNSEETKVKKAEPEEVKVKEPEPEKGSEPEEESLKNVSHGEECQEKVQAKVPEKIQVKAPEKIQARELTPDESRVLGTHEKLKPEHSLKTTDTDHSHFESKREETIRVRTSSLDNIMNLVGELVINKGRLFQISQEYDISDLEEASSSLEKSISSLQDEVMRIRMIKIDRVFSKFPRMVRDLSRKFGKSINFEIEGQETELDRTILDEINDPLVHLIRNAVDHGIELPEERAKTGKSETGHIKLSARRERNNVIIEIEDDGQGMNLDLIKKKALEKGVISSSELENLSEEEVRMLVFTPGFSTKDSATEISGRGVGMDVVKTTVEKLGGKVRVYSKVREYTKIQINLPPTVAIIKSLLVEVEHETYAIPISNVVKALNVESGDYRFVRGSPVLCIRNKLVPVLKLRELFKIPEEKLEKELAIIVEKEDEEVGLIVDSIVNQQEIVIKPLGSAFSNLKGFIGVTILGDGRIIPILDVSLLIKGDIDD